MRNKIILSVLFILTLFLFISCVSASENLTDVLVVEDSQSLENLQNDVDNDIPLQEDVSENVPLQQEVSQDVPLQTDESPDEAPIALHDSNPIQNDDSSDDEKKSDEVKVVKSKTKIKASNVDTCKNYKDKFTVKLTSNKKALANKPIKIKLNGVTYNKKTNSKGEASLGFKLKKGTYTVKISFLGDEKYKPSNGTAKIFVKSYTLTHLKVADKDIAYREGLNSLFELKLLTDKNKAIGGKKVTISVSGKKYSAKTNSKGIATFHLKLKKGTHDIKYSFSKSGKYFSSSGHYKIKVKTKLGKGDGYWVDRWHVFNVNLKKLSKTGTKNIFLLHTSFSKYGEAKILKWIKKAHKYGMKVHIWISVFYKGKFIHPVSKNGVYNYKFMNKIIKQVKHYSQLKGVDGIHFDYLRFGGTAYQYKNSVDAVNYFVKKACRTIRSVNPDIIISAAVMPEPNDMKYYYAQDIPTMSKYLDVIVPMVYKGNYEAGSKWIKKTTKQFVERSNGAIIWTGLQSYHSDSNIQKLSYKSLFKDAKYAKSGGASGIVIFRWGLSELINFNKLWN